MSIHEAAKQQRAAANKTVMEKPAFIEACKYAGVTVSRRQASKWRQGRGRAYKTYNHIPI